MVLSILLLHPIVSKLLILSFSVCRRNDLAWATTASCSLFRLVGAVTSMIRLILITVGA